MDTIQWTQYNGHNTMDTIQWHNTVDTIQWTQYNGHNTMHYGRLGVVGILDHCNLIYAN